MPITVASQSFKHLALSQVAKAEDLGTSRSMVQFWETGTRKPNEFWRGRIFDVYAIPHEDWDIEPLIAPVVAIRSPKPKPVPVVAPPVPTPPEIDPSDIISGARAQLVRLAKRIAECEDERILVRFEEIERSTRHSLSMYLGEGRVISEAVILRSPAFARIFAKITKALRNHPDALLELTESLEASNGD